jgi:hypothetical protein
MTSGLGSTATYGIYLDNYKTAGNYIGNLQIDCAGNVDYGLRIVSNMVAENVVATGCNVAGFRGQTLDSTIMRGLNAIGNHGAGMVIDKATDGDSINTSNNTNATLEASSFQGNGQEGLVLLQLQGSRLSQLTFQGNGSYGLRIDQLLETPGVSFLDFNTLWFEDNRGEYELYLTSQNTGFFLRSPDNLMFTNVWVDAFREAKSIGVSEGRYIDFKNIRVSITGGNGDIDLGPGSEKVAFYNRQGGFLYNTGVGNSDNAAWIYTGGH